MMEILRQNQYKALCENFTEPQNFRPSEGGHMAYRRMLFDDSNGETFFVKAHDPSLLSEEWRREEMAYFLEKESRVYEHLEAHQYEHAPKLELYAEDMLVLRGLTRQQGWHWRMPDQPEFQEKYMEDVLTALKNLESVPPMEPSEKDEISVDTFYNHGWDKLHDINIPSLVLHNLARWLDVLHDETPRQAALFLKDPMSLAVKRRHMRKDIFNHHDARQSNIAWHPEFGARIVDWSWADGGLPEGDATMFLLDLHKAGYNINSFETVVNPIYTKMMLGYWLQRSQTEHMEGNDGVRMHQFVSAIKAACLLKQQF